MSASHEGEPVSVNSFNKNNQKCSNSPKDNKESDSQSSSENLRNNHSKSKSESPGENYNKKEKESSDPFFSDFYNRKKNRPRLSERIFNRDPKSSIFERDSFVDDLRKQLDEERKMFFDADPFAQFQRGGSPGPGTGTGSPRMGRAGAGFPFESAARSRLDDFPGGRHPMFSTMRRPGWDEDPFSAGNPFHRERNNSGSSGCASGSSTASAEHEHIIPIRIERSDGSSATTTTNGNSGNNTHANKASARANGSVQVNNPISVTPIPMPAPEGMTPTPPPPQTQNVHQAGPQRSSTGVKSSVASGERSPRAQSAPPDSMSEGENKKYVSSVNIDIDPNNPTPSAPQFNQLGGNCTKEKTPPKDASGRQIPIVVEGHQGRPFPNPRNNNAAPHSHDVPQQQQQQQQKSSRPAEREVTPPPKKPAPPKDPLEKVVEISNDVKELEVDVDQFKGNSRKDKDYLYLDEMLTRNLIKLDLIETEGREDIRLARKDCIKLIQNCIAKLEAKAPLPSQSETAMELYQSSEQLESSSDQNMEVDNSQSNKSKESDSVPSGDNQSTCSSKSESTSAKSATDAAIPLGSGDNQSLESVKVTG